RRAELLSIATDASVPTWQRRAAAWRVGRVNEEQANSILAAEMAEAGDGAWAAALLAERLLAHERAAAQVGQWIGGGDETHSRAGALLAALLGEHREDLLRAYADELRGPVRTIQRLALGSLGATINDEVNWIELAYRAQRRPDGDFDADAALCLLAA